MPHCRRRASVVLCQGDQLDAQTYPRPGLDCRGAQDRLQSVLRDGGAGAGRQGCAAVRWLARGPVRLGGPVAEQGLDLNAAQSGAWVSLWDATGDAAGAVMLHGGFGEPHRAWMSGAAPMLVDQQMRSVVMAREE